MQYTSTLIGNLKIIKADTFLTRLKGLLFSECLSDEQVLMITPCNSIHTIGMSYDIHVIFLSKCGIVLKVCQSVKPNQIRLGPKGTYQVIETSAKIEIDSQGLIGKSFIKEAI